jgi:hypothetical protein
MSRYRYVRGILLTLIVGMLPIGAHARGRKNATYDGAVDFASQLLHLDDDCLSVDGAVSSGNFFEDLKRLDIGSRSEYRKGGGVVTEYPESLTTSIRILGGQCAAALPNALSSIFSGDSYSLMFEVQWKDGTQLRPAVLSPVVAHCVGSRILTIPSKDFTIPSITCQNDG